jgi:hypothetical protein
MRYSDATSSLKVTSPPTKRRTPPSEQTDEASGSIESEEVDIEREAPVGENQSVERVEPGERPAPPLFED